MFDIGFFELTIIGIVALLVLGPERLPRAARTAGMWVGRAKRMVTQVKRDIDDEMRQEELAELREARDSLSKTRESMNSFQQELNQQVDTDEEAKSKSASPGKSGSTSESAAGTTDEPATGETADSRTGKSAASKPEKTADSRPNESTNE